MTGNWASQQAREVGREAERGRQRTGWAAPHRAGYWLSRWP